MALGEHCEATIYQQPKLAAASDRSWAATLARYRDPSLARSILEIVITVLPLALLWLAMWAALGVAYWLCVILAVQQAPRPGEREILPDRQHIDVADATMIEVAGMRVVDGVGPSPKVIRRQGQHADHPTDPIVGEAMPEKRAMAAVVLDHE